MLSPLANWGLGQINGGKSSWRYMYYFAGALTIAWGIALWFILPPDPVRARGFSDRERYILVARLRTNNAGVRNTRFKGAQVRELLLDLNFWTVFAIAFLSQIPNGPMSSFIPIIINGMGFSELHSLLLKMPSGAFGAVMTIALGYCGSRFKNIRIYLFVLAMTVTVMSSLILWLVPVEKTGALLFAIYVLPSFSSGYSMIMGLQISNTAGYTKKTLSSAGIFVGYCLGKSSRTSILALSSTTIQDLLRRLTLGRQLCRPHAVCREGRTPLHTWIHGDGRDISRLYTVGLPLPLPLCILEQEAQQGGR